ncbi:MAG: hypothetical protein HOM68_12505 [Gemmatimonadetes bacterium]|jgi:hypothetical protein|nr:hypothetical protein [Gemmatimonadota bacterium]MBT5145895.1 hypothetical protein [Gemmatimonadota bacterium]MBT5589969.1 hypothetical protein [Gemmatimonadota bacterium]MBT5963391.1 hypothetical protein [Gemmatimonadota bacterium]MBT7455127.1 hypothetical protein [Gemmatimonadota bacterium]
MMTVKTQDVQMDAQETATQRITTSFSADTLYDEADRTIGLWKGGAEDHIHLFQGEVVETDSPASGRSDDPDIQPFLRLDGPAQISKTLHLDGADGSPAQIGFVGIEDEGNTATLQLHINGVEVLRPPSSQATPEARQYQELSWSRWYYVDIPPSALHEGDNEVCLSAVDGGVGWQVMVADDRDVIKGMEDPLQLAHSSKRSDDCGATWVPERGEYVIRLLLDRYVPAGEFLAAVFDAAGEENDAIKGHRTVERLQVRCATTLPDSTELQLFVRTGPCPSPGASPEGPSPDTRSPETRDWSDWMACESGSPVADVRGRYVQVKAAFVTHDRRQSPQLDSVTIDAQVVIGEENKPRIAASQNARIQRSSYDMPHEDPRCRLLRQLRSECELDAIVTGAQTEFEKIQRLHRWAYHIPLGDCTHFPWNILDWIDVRRDDNCSIELNEYSQRRRDKMCLYPNVVLVAALQSFGIVARHLNFHSEGMTGHEICEVWSNDYGKWIHLDATRDYYFFDRRTLTPLDTEEIHQVLIARLDEVETWERPYLYRQDLDALVEDLPISYWDGDYEHSAGSGDHGALFLFRSFCHFRVIPRFDVFSRSRPLPVSQGTEVWSWNGYVNWADDKVPPLRHFSTHTNRRADMYPTLNQTHFTAQSQQDGRQVQIWMQTATPDFDCFEVRLNGDNWQPAEGAWNWSLRDGMNSAEMRTRNRSGVTGVISALSVVV